MILREEKQYRKSKAGFRAKGITNGKNTIS